MVVDIDEKLRGLGNTADEALKDALEEFGSIDEGEYLYLYKLTEVHNIIVSKIGTELVEEVK